VSHKMAANRPFTWSNMRDLNDLNAFRQYLMDNRLDADDIGPDEVVACIHALTNAMSGEKVKIAQSEQDRSEHFGAQMERVIRFVELTNEHLDSVDERLNALERKLRRVTDTLEERATALERRLQSVDATAQHAREYAINAFGDHHEMLDSHATRLERIEQGLASSSHMMTG
jgi:DNA repair ATPase RecN